MSNGDQIDKVKSASLAPSALAYKLLDGATAVTTGTWVDTRTLKMASVEVFGSFSGTVQIRGSNEVAAPTADSGQLIQSVTAGALVSIPYPVRWVKAVVTAYTSGTINANYHGVC